jgi:hypothetical protein
MNGCEWFQVHDFIEALYAHVAENDSKTAEFGGRAGQFTAAVNRLFVEQGIGWQLVDGQIDMRGTEAFEAALGGATAALETSGRTTAATHLHEALQALSRRPEADLAGAIYHAMGSLECVAPDLTGDRKAKLGEALKRNPGLLPKPLDTALAQVW